MADRTAYRSFVSYIDKSREYYAAHGYEHPYQWAQHHDVPFAPLAGPLADRRVGVVTTTFLPELRPGGENGPKRSYAAPSEPPEAMFTADLSWDKDATHTDDVETYLPLTRLRELAEAGRIGDVSPRFYGVPTEYSQRRTREIDGPQIVQWCQEDDVDVVLLIPL